MSGERGGGVSLDDDAEHFSPHVSHLNTLPSRQNVLLQGGPHLSTPGCLPKESHSLAGLGEQAAMLRSPRPRIRSTSKHDAAQANALEAPLLSESSLKTIPGAISEDVLDESDALSMKEAVFNLINNVVGVGVLSVPYAFRLSGYVTLLLIVLVINVTSYTGKLIGAALTLAEKSPESRAVSRKGRDFAFLAFVAFGNKGKFLIGAVTSLEVWCALVTFVVMNGVNAELLWPEVGRAPAVAVSAVLGGLTVFVPMRFFSYLSLISSVALLAAAFALIGSAMMMDSWANPYDQLGAPALLKPNNVPRSVGLLVFCFAGHPCFPIVHECMRDRSKWGASINISFCVALLYYGCFGVFGYLVFGEILYASFTENLAAVKGALLFRNIAAFAFLVKIQLTAPLLLNATMVAMWAPAAGAREWPPARVAALFALTAFTTFVAVTFSDAVAELASLTGSSFTMVTSVLFPTVVHLHLSRSFKTSHASEIKTMVLDVLVICFGVVMAIAGTVFAVHDLAAVAT